MRSVKKSKKLKLRLKGGTKGTFSSNNNNQPKYHCENGICPKLSKSIKNGVYFLSNTVGSLFSEAAIMRKKAAVKRAIEARRRAKKVRRSKKAAKAIPGRIISNSNSNSNSN